ncbi:ACP S-malonyltransferase [Planococcus lenghuensis]|uniref:Malonyl CoA-acyl carrier protein transacylase n=1 Tax=Planococcus lenghuensis TaxID=2213202 RepID=A0A1Q2KZX9_9BACL|nr:ACP S-malonyltransferase [Planococcus lenghuensis]AQQ53755.1 [acyl-carrier-protein] S-malonyltransferase [Planococcus lenghuensis]
MTKIAFIFPGQGSQSIGMGASFSEDERSRSFFDQADEALGFSLSQLIQEGPQEELTLTYNAQPALLTVSALIAERLERAGIKPDYTAGHSLGEYSALVASGVLTFKEAVDAVYQRGLLMNEAVPAGKGAMAAVLGLGAKELARVTDEVTADGQSVQLANINCPGQIVISGTKEGVERASALAKEQGAKRAIPLDVSGPFHSELMEPASEGLRKTLDAIDLAKAEPPVISNVTAQPVTEPAEIRDLLVRQLYSPVQWEQSVREMISQGVTVFIEAGPGKVLSGLVKKIDRSVKVIPVFDEETLEKAVEELTQ